MAWISVYQEVDGPKLRKLARLLETSRAEALGILNFLWFWGMNNADETGKVLEAGREDIEDTVAGVSRIKPEAVVNALFEAGWLDTVEGDIYIHDWDTWQEQWYKLQKTRKYNTERMRRKRSEEKENHEHQDAPETESNQPSTPVINEALGRVMTTYMDKIDPTPSSTSLEELKGYVERLGAEVCFRAINCAIDAGMDKRNWRYIRGILRDKQANNVRSNAEWDRLEERRKPRSSAPRPENDVDLSGIFGGN